MIKRLFDISVSLLLLLLFLPLIIVIALIIKINSKGRIFYLQKRVGKDNIDFNIIKFRTMHEGSDKKGLLTIGGNDSRITPAGRLLRKYKLDELPQLFNVLSGEMSLVGPRPEVRKYVELYSEEQKRVIGVKPGITDYASILYIGENEILGKSDNPEKEYIQTIMPEKLKLNLKYINNASLITDVKIILKTVIRILFHR
jgi:lipopolysaccharide/colanic/teichoic acid biosynthesis glycosyltransferase